MPATPSKSLALPLDISLSAGGAALLFVALQLTACSADLDCESLGAVEDDGKCVFLDAGSSLEGGTSAPDAECEGTSCDAGCPDGSCGPTEKDAGAPGPGDAAVDGSDAAVDAEADSGVVVDPVADDDGDGLANADDNCPGAGNPEQEDHDGDGEGNACDGDRDDDGVANDEDACPLGRATGTDTDGDGCFDDEEDEDDDGDGVPDDEDVCRLVSDPEQHDLDDDGVGDACEEDTDGDGISDGEDACTDGGAEGDDTDGDGCLDAGEDDDDDGDGLTDEEDHCPLVAGEEDVDLDGCPTTVDACPTGGHVGPDTDGDGCLDIQDPSADNPDIPGVPHVVYVNADASEAEANGESWDTAFPFLQDGIAAANVLAAAGDDVEVWIAAGRYFPDDSVSRPGLAGDRNAAFLPRTGVKLVGGFEYTDGAWTRGAIGETVLSGDIDNNDSSRAIAGANACRVVGGADDSGARFDAELSLNGLTIEGADLTDDGSCADVPDAFLDAGAVSSAGIVRLTQVKLTKNRAAGNRCAALWTSSLVAVDVAIENNASEYSAACVQQSRAHGLTVRGNDTSGPTNGALLAFGGSLTVVNSVFTGNRAAGAGAGAALTVVGSGAIDVRHTTVVGNRATNTNSAVVSAGSVRLSHVLALDNTRWMTNGTTPTYTLSIVEGAGTGSGLIQPDVIDATSIFVSPVNATASPTTGGDFHLRRSDFNPAVDAGSDELPPCPSGEGFANDWDRMALPDGTRICLNGKLRVDAGGDLRRQGDAVDIGAYELSQ